MLPDPKNMTLGQLLAVIPVLKADMASRRASFAQQRQEIQGRIGSQVVGPRAQGGVPQPGVQLGAAAPMLPKSGGRRAQFQGKWYREGPDGQMVPE